MNHSDSERIASVLEKYGFRPLRKEGGADLSAEALAKADLAVFNTCGVRQMAEDRVYGQIHNLRKSNPDVKIILTGCLSNRKDVQRRLKNKVDLFCEIKNFLEKINKLLVTSYELRVTSQNSGLNRYLNIKPKYNTEYSAYVPIMTGCNNFCAYCVVPHARGREISRPAGEIINEIKSLIKKGYKEIILLGQNVNSYKDGNVNFPKLLKKINDLTGKFWLKFISSHPKDMSDELIKTITKSKKVCEYVHLPIQAGDDKVLKRMNRKYNAKHYLKLIKKIESAFGKYKPGIIYSLTSDIIVGFPGETNGQFLKSADIMERIPYDMVYFGQYSPRPNTIAWKMKDNVSKKEKVRREKYLNEILKKTTFANNKKYVGKVFEVLVDKKLSPFGKWRGGERFEKPVKTRDSKIPLNPPFPKGETIYFGKTRTMKNVKFTATETDLIGKFVKVKIIKANIWSLMGVISN